MSLFTAKEILDLVNRLEIGTRRGHLVWVKEDDFKGVLEYAGFNFSIESLDDDDEHPVQLEVDEGGVKLAQLNTFEDDDGPSARALFDLYLLAKQSWTGMAAAKVRLFDSLLRFEEF